MSSPMHDVAVLLAVEDQIRLVWQGLRQCRAKHRQPCGLRRIHRNRLWALVGLRHAYRQGGR